MPVSPAVSRADSRSRAGMQPSCVLTVLMPMGCRVHRQLGVPPQSSVVAGGRPTRSSASAHLHRSCWTRSAAPRQPDPTGPTCGQTSRRQRSPSSHRGTSPSPRCCSPEPHTRGSPRRWEPTARCRSPRPTRRRAAAPHHAADTRRGRLLPTLRRHLRPTVPTSHRRAAAARLHGQSLTTASSAAPLARPRPVVRPAAAPTGVHRDYVDAATRTAAPPTSSPPHRGLHRSGVRVHRERLEADGSSTPNACPRRA
jgi:hypothetical protein